MSATRDDEKRNAGIDTCSTCGSRLRLAGQGTADEDTCPTCGSRVRIVGTTTMHYEPAADAPSLTPPAPPPEGAAGQDKNRRWHQHLDGCFRCATRPLDLCPVGVKILTSP